MLRDTRVRAVVWALIGTLVAAVVALVLVAAALTAQIRHTQLAGTPVGQKLVASSDRILDCTDPGGPKKTAGKCYQRNQQQLAQVVSNIGTGQILAVVCALNVPNGTPLPEALDQVTRCVAARVASQHR